METTCCLTFYHDVIYYLKDPLLPHHVSALSFSKEKDLETLLCMQKKSTNFGNKKEKTQMLCLMLHKQLPLSIHSYSELLHQWSVAHCFSKLCLYRALSSIFSKSRHLATFNCNMVAIKLKFWLPPKGEREREWRNSDVWKQKLLTTKLLRPCNKSCLIPFWSVAQLRNISILTQAQILVLKPSMLQSTP